MARVTVKDVQAMTALYFGLPTASMKSPSKKMEFVRARMVAYSLVRDFTGLSFPKIGQFFGGRDHTTILFGIRRAKALDGREAVAMARLPALVSAFAEIRGRHVDWWLRQGPCVPVSERPTVRRGMKKPTKRAPPITIKARLWEDSLGVRWAVRDHVEAQRAARVEG